jgi:uncharacterized protein YyaL (SSP411 family)
LFDIREKRIHPLKDDKILTDWNGLMIAALAQASRTFGENPAGDNQGKYIREAERAWNFLHDSLRQENGRLLHRYRDGEAIIPGFLDDYAFLAWGAFELYQTTLNVEYLEECQSLCEEMLRLFTKEETASLAFSAADNEKLFLENTEGYDGAMPSGNSVAAYTLARLGVLTNNTTFMDKAEAIINSFGEQIKNYPIGYAQMLSAMTVLQSSRKEIILAGDRTDATFMELQEAINKRFQPYAVIAWNDNSEVIKKLIPYIEFQTAKGGKPTVYVCEDYACKAPVTSVEELEKVLGEK